MFLSTPACRWTTRSLLTTQARLSHLRFSSSTSDASASTIATSFLSRFQSLGPQTRSQTLDANQLRLLSLTLNRPSLFPASPHLSSTTAPNNASTADVEPAPGTPVPAGYHLVYFTPAFLENELGADGTDSSYNPAHPFTRRMWAGGEVLWPRKNGQPNPLRVGDNVTETTRVLSAEPKIVRKTGEEMIVVGVEKEFSNAQGVAVVDRRYAPTTYLILLVLINPWCRIYLLTGIQKLGLSQSSPTPDRYRDRNANGTKPSTRIPSIPAPRLRRNIIERPHAYTHTAPNSCNALSLLSINL